jgi:hypothetical protein
MSRFHAGIMGMMLRWGAVPEDVVHLEVGALLGEVALALLLAREVPHAVLLDVGLHQLEGALRAVEVLHGARRSIQAAADAAPLAGLALARVHEVRGAPMPGAEREEALSRPRARDVPRHARSWSLARCTLVKPLDREKVLFASLLARGLGRATEICCTSLFLSSSFFS